ncbi:MAG TPA: substrate-binding domain-containing protein [Stellaceae bacterium]|nr:substrate-binding domain-containing protein [Stellaceae bacterium]
MLADKAVLRLDLVWSAGTQPRRPIEPELFALLEAIRQTGKLTAATNVVRLPYRQAWGLIEKWSGVIGQPLVAKEQGRGTRLTPLGERLLWLRERIEARLTPHLESAVSEVEQQLGDMLDAPAPMLSLYASHDLVLAELRDWLRGRAGPKLDVRFVGSLDSVVALCKGRCEIAGFHVPEGALGAELFATYQPWLKPRLQRLVQFVRRRQGLMVLPGNPIGVRSIGDIVRTQARFINRQRGSGTRLALERMLKDQSIDRGEIAGFYSEEFTHLAVAAAVASGMADVGMGIEAAAAKLGLEFIPIFTEDYYLLTKREALEQKSIVELVAILSSSAFRDLVSGIPGYDAGGAGTIKMIGETTPGDGR